MLLFVMTIKLLLVSDELFIISTVPSLQSFRDSTLSSTVAG